MLPKYQLNLSNYYKWDLRLAKYNSELFCCVDYNKNELLSNINFNTSGQTCSLTSWEDAVADTENLCDFILTGYDNGFLNYFSSETIVFSSTTFCLYPVSGSSYCYNYSIEEESGVTYSNLCGGFYQGFYKLEGYNYEVLPSFYPNGVSYEITFRKKDNLCEECADLPLLNNNNEDNANFIFYLGTRAENKFCNLNENEMGLLTCDGTDSLSDPYEIVQRKIFENAFLFYNDKNICEFTGFSYDVQVPSCCDDLIDNVLGIRFTSDNRINVRVITTTGSCVNDKWEDEIVINNYYSEPNSFSSNTWTQMVVRFEPNTINECDEIVYGTLSVFINGKLKLLIKDFKELKPFALTTNKAKQLGVPYTISIGGGTQGLLESVDIGEQDDNLFSGDTLCNYVFKMNSCYSLKGVIVNNEQILAPTLIEHDDFEGIRTFLLESIPNRYGNIVVEQRGFGGELQTYIMITYSKDEVNMLMFTDSFFQTPFETKCFDIPEHFLKCFLLENYFVGTFIGDIHSFNIYNKALPIQEINCYLSELTFILT